MPTAPPQGTGQGIFQYVTKINGDDAQVRQAQAQLAQLTPETQAVFQTLNLLPEGGLKKWLMANPVQFWKMIGQLFTGKKYTTGQYILGERYNDQILCNVGGKNIDRRQVSDEMAAAAQNMFTILFGVRITTGEDLDALDNGVDAYYARGGKNDVPRNSVERAVYLKQKFFPISTYNNKCWDIGVFEKYPLVAPIPGLDVNTKFNGELPGGAKAVEGLIPIDAITILKQYPNAKFDAKTGLTSTPDDKKIKDQSASQWYKKWWWWAIIGGAVIGTVATIVILTKPKK